MIRNYLNIALRTLWKNKMLSAINVVGLSLGLACFSLLMLHIYDEFSFDRFHRNSDRIFRVYRHIFPFNGEPESSDPYLPMPLGPAMKADLPDVEQYVRICDWDDQFVRSNRLLTARNIVYADPQIFEVLNFPLLYGDPHTALADPNGVVLTEQAALDFFGEKNPVGKTLEIKVADVFEPFIVTAVVRDVPPNSSIRFDILASFDKHAASKFGKKGVDNWNRSAYFTLVQLRPGSGLLADSARLQQFYNKYHPEEASASDGNNPPAGAPPSYRLQPLAAWHTDPEVGGGEVAPVNPRYGWILLGLGSLVLLIACINFTTLSIGRSAGRAREIGVRKVTGARRSQLVGQFLTESLLLSVVSMALAGALVWLFLPSFNELVGKKLRFDLSVYPQLGWMLAGLTLFTGLVAGAYPALVLSGFRPVEALKSKFRVAGSNLFTKSLVTFQFVLSVGLIACTFIMLRQLHFLQEKNPGFNKENVLVVNADDADTKRIFPLFKQALSAQPAVAGVASAELGLGAKSGWSRSGFGYQGQQKQVYEYFIDPEYMSVLGLDLLAGRLFDPAISADTVTSVIINEAMMRDFGWTMATAPGQELQGYFDDGKNNPVVIGVVRDFNFMSLHKDVKPMMFHMFKGYQPYKFFVRLRPGAQAEGIAAARKAWTDAEPNLPFRYTFLDENLARFYESESRWTTIVGYAGALAVALACLGLFGLVALAALKRTKEIGIRKILGASVVGITRLLAADLVRLVLIAIAIATPVAWLVMRRWLADFAYRIELGWVYFALAGLSAVLIAVLTVSFQSIRAALTDPVKSLRSE